MKIYLICLMMASITMKILHNLKMNFKIQIKIKIFLKIFCKATMNNSLKKRLYKIIKAYKNKLETLKIGIF